MTLGELAQGAVATLAERTLCSGTMQDEHLPAGTRVKVSWHGEISTFVDVLSGERRGQTLPCRPAAVVVEEGLATTTSDVTGRGHDDAVDPLRRPAMGLDFGQRQPLQERPDAGKGTPRPQRAAPAPARTPAKGKRK